MVASGFGPDLQHPQVSRSTEARQADGSRAWHTLAPMRRRRSNLTAAGTESAVYAIGGVTLSGRIRASVERFEDGAWHDAPRLPARRTRAGAAALGGPIFVAGGLVSPSSAATETVIALDPDMGGWRSAAPMRRPRHSLRLVATSQHLYAIGGRAGNDELVSDVERYDPRARHVDDGRADGTGPSASRSGGDELRWRRSDRRCRRRTFTANRGLPTARRTTEIYRVADDKWHLLDVRLPHPANRSCARRKPTTLCWPSAAKSTARPAKSPTASSPSNLTRPDNSSNPVQLRTEPASHRAPPPQRAATVQRGSG